MAFASLGSDKQNTPFRSEDGARALIHPTELPGEIKKYLSGCVGCSKLPEHGPCELIASRIPFGETRHQRIDDSQKIRVEDIARLQAALWVVGYAFHPYDNGQLVYNAGQANNQSQSLTYEIVSCSGSTLTLKGRNPKKIVVGNSIPNPDWPLSGGRFLDDTIETAMVIGSQVEFLEPSVLADKLKPFVKSVSPPTSETEDGVTFSVEVSASVSNAKTPIDAKYPAAKYYCRIWWWAVSPEAWGRFDVPEETQFTRREVFVSVVDLVDRKLEFRNSFGFPCRVIYPGMMAGAILVAAEVGKTWEWKTSDWALSRLTTIQVAPGTWRSWIDLADLLAEFPGASRVRVVFYPEAVEGDVFRIPFASGCANCQQDRSGSYEHADGWRCTNVDASGFEAFTRECWQPVGKTGTGCNGFGLGYSGNSFGELSAPLDDLRRSSLISRLYQRSSWILSQGFAGISSARNFTLVMPSGGGVSLGSLFGGWADSVPIGLFGSNEPLYPASFGQRTTSSGVDGDDHEIQHGLYCARTEWTAGTTPDPGFLYNTVSGWDERTGALGSGMDSRLALFPTRGAGRCHLHTYAYSGGGFSVGNRLVADQELFLVGINSAEVDDEFQAEISARFGGS